MFDNFEFNPDLIPKLKLGIHGLQVVVSFVIWCLAIAVFADSDSSIIGNNGWTFGVTFLSIPAWLYLVGTPRWPRTRRLAEPHVMLVVDTVFCVIWLSAFATQAAYNSSDNCGGACRQSAAVVGLGVFEWLLWVASSAVSILTLRHYRFHGDLPGYDKQRLRNNDIDPDKAAFSMAPHDEEAYAPVQMDDHPGHAGDTSYGGVGGSDIGPSSTGPMFSDNPYRAGGGSSLGPEDDDPNRYGSLPSRHNAMFDQETEYNSQPPPMAGGPRQPSPYAPPTLQDDPYDDGPAQFPPANYDRTMR